MQAMHHNDVAIDHGLVSAKAYELWQSKGCPEGVADQIWFEAEQQLRASVITAKRRAATEALDTACTGSAKAAASEAGAIAPEDSRTTLPSLRIEQPRLAAPSQPAAEPSHAAAQSAPPPAASSSPSNSEPAASSAVASHRKKNNGNQRRSSRR